MDAADLTIRHAQRNQPWTVPSSDGVRHARNAGWVPHILASHAVLHAAKSVGKLAAVFEALDHTGGPAVLNDYLTIRAMSADLVTAALRLANLFDFDLAAELVARVREKNGVNVLELQG
jgi:hypothetical protein